MRRRRIYVYSLFMLWLCAMLPLIGYHSLPVAAESPQNIYENPTFTVNYNPESCEGEVQAWPADGQAAMNHVVDIIDDLISNNVNIEVDACYKVDPDPNTLASAGPTSSVSTCETGSGSLPMTPTPQRSPHP